MSLQEATELLVKDHNLTELHYLYYQCCTRDERLAEEMVKILQNRSTSLPEKMPEKGLFQENARTYVEMNSGIYRKEGGFYAYQPETEEWIYDPNGWPFFLNSSDYRIYDNAYKFFDAAYYGNLRYTDAKPEGWKPLEIQWREREQEREREREKAKDEEAEEAKKLKQAIRRVICLCLLFAAFLVWHYFLSRA